MERNGDDYGFSFVWARRLQSIEASGANGDDLDNLKGKARSITAKLSEFRTLFATLEQSGEHTPKGLQLLVEKAAATVAGEIRKLCNVILVDEDIRRTRQKLVARVEPDPIDKLFKLLQMQEIRSALENQGVSRDDTLSADVSYRDAMEKGDLLTMEAMESWPLGSPVSRDLVTQGQALRHDAADPVTSAKLRDLQTFKDAVVQMEKDGLQELPLASDTEIKML